VTRGCAPEAAADAPPAAASAEASMRQVYDAIIPLRSLGYVPRINKELLAPTEDDALAWLGPRELLIAFNPHALVPRQGDVDWGHTVRVIRAALVDVSTHTVERTLEWRLPDMNQFLWLLPGNRVLVHVENELRVYGPGLRVEKRISLAGQLAFARISPNGKVIALGLKRERHTADLHARLAAIIGKDPPEDMQVLMLNDRFDTIGTAMSSSDRVAPVLLDEGQVKAVPAGGHGGREDRHYALQLRTWSGQTRSVARFQSACAPGVSSLPPDLLFLVTCNRLNGARSYRVLRPDGSTLMHGDSFLRELGHAASGGGAPGMFAVRIFMADEPVMPGEPFHATDLQSAELVLYRSEDGKRLFSVRAKDPAASLGGYAISPAGEVAILTEDDVNVYKAPVN
jgi:hypothetical protein